MIAAFNTEDLPHVLEQIPIEVATCRAYKTWQEVIKEGRETDWALNKQTMVSNWHFSCLKSAVLERDLACNFCGKAHTPRTVYTPCHDCFH